MKKDSGIIRASEKKVPGSSGLLNYKCIWTVRGLGQTQTMLMRNALRRFELLPNRRPNVVRRGRRRKIGGRGGQATPPHTFQNTSICGHRTY